MKKFDTRVYSISDFLEWDDNGLLELSPDFQRRNVWSEKAKSYLIDTILRGKPIPKILISQELKSSRNIRVVVDGQQRLRAILEFINGDFKISRAHNEKYANYTYERLPDELQNEFLKYELGVDILFDMKYEDILDIFARVNSYTVTLNKQEKFNARFLGFYKKYSFKYGYKYLNYFLDGSILTKRSVTRMGEAELSADLFMALSGGVQTNKNIEKYYKKYEDDEGNLEYHAKQFDKIMSFVGEIYEPEDIANTNWSRKHLFYTLFTAIGHCLYNLGGLDKEKRIDISNKSIGRLRVILDEISSQYDLYTNESSIDDAPDDLQKFIDMARRRTTDTAARVYRAEFVTEKILDELGTNA